MLGMIASAAGAASAITSISAGSDRKKDFIGKDHTMWEELKAFENGQYVLPELPYDYDALEPMLDEKTLRIHHDKHHAGYVKKLNAAVARLEQMRQSNDYASIQAVSNELAFNSSSHVLHTIFWHSMRLGAAICRRNSIGTGELRVGRQCKVAVRRRDRRWRQAAGRSCL